MTRATGMPARKKVRGENLIARKDGLLCVICGEVEPIHGGESGTPLPSLLIAYEAAIRRHPSTEHERHTPRPR